MPTWLGLNFQDSGSPFMTHLTFLHDHIMTVMLFVLVFIFYLMVYLVFSSMYYKHFSEGTMVETVWSIIPALFLIALVLPSMQVLYLMEDIKFPTYTFKVVGHQWYWTYIAPLYKNFSYSFLDEHYSFFEFDSMMDLDSELPRLLGCSNGLCIPSLYTSRFLVTSTDVIHSFAVPSMSLKVDAVPGRINQIFSVPLRCGVFFGECSEICGSNHSFMPIVLFVADISLYDKVCLHNTLSEVLNLDSLIL